jgi:hypothetical protein
MIPTPDDINSKAVSFTTSLLKMLDSRRGLGVSDMRDMVYGNLSIIESVEMGLVQVDYRKTGVDVFEDVARLCVEWLDFEQVLQRVETRDLGARPEDLASWCPNVRAHFPLTMRVRAEVG